MLSSESFHAQQHSKTLSVLMVEDNKLISLVHSSMLEDLKCVVETAATGKEALEKADCPYDLILLDVGLPDMQGTELAEKLRSHPRHQKTQMVFVTTISKEILKEKCQSCSIHQVINKPVDKKYFQAVVSQLNS